MVPTVRWQRSNYSTTAEPPVLVRQSEPSAALPSTPETTSSMVRGFAPERGNSTRLADLQTTLSRLLSVAEPSQITACIRPTPPNLSHGEPRSQIAGGIRRL